MSLYAGTGVGRVIPAGGGGPIGEAKGEVFRYNSDLQIKKNLTVRYDGGTKTKHWCE